MPERGLVPCFAIVRLDDWPVDEAGSLPVNARDRVTVTKVVWDEAEADQEVARLNASAARSGRANVTHYFSMATRARTPLPL